MVHMCIYIYLHVWPPSQAWPAFGQQVRITNSVIYLRTLHHSKHKSFEFEFNKLHHWSGDVMNLHPNLLLLWCGWHLHSIMILQFRWVLAERLWLLRQVKRTSKDAQAWHQESSRHWLFRSHIASPEKLKIRSLQSCGLDVKTEDRFAKVGCLRSIESCLFVEMSRFWVRNIHSVHAFQTIGQLSR